MALSPQGMGEQILMMGTAYTETVGITHFPTSELTGQVRRVCSQPAHFRTGTPRRRQRDFSRCGCKGSYNSLKIPF